MGVALLGAALGILNTWQSLSANRVRLRVKPAHAITPNGVMFAIEVVNLSNFPVTLDEVGFTLNGNTVSGGPRAAVTNPIFIDGGTWPRRLEARQAVSTYFDPRRLVLNGHRLGRAYASTACGETRYGTSPAAKQLRQELSS